MKSFSKPKTGAFILNPDKSKQFFSEKRCTSSDLLRKAERFSKKNKSSKK